MAARGPEALAERVHAAGVVDERVLDAIRSVPRAGFVPPEFLPMAYLDEPIPIPRQQVTTQPSLSAHMIAALDLDPADRVLEVGTGYGFQTALLARLAGVVHSIELDPTLAEVARASLAAVGLDEVAVAVGDGTLGRPEDGPYDAILVSAAFPHVPPPLVQQLVEGGRLVQPIGQGGDEEVVLFVKRDGELEGEAILTGARFVPLRGRYGFEA